MAYYSGCLMLHKIKMVDLMEAMTEPVLLISMSGEGAKFNVVSKQVYFIPVTGLFIIRATGRPDEAFRDKRELIDTFNKINMRNLK